MHKQDIKEGDKIEGFQAEECVKDDPVTFMERPEKSCTFGKTNKNYEN